MVTGGTISVKLNNLTGSYIKSFKGVRQVILYKAQSNNLFCGLADHIIEKGVAVLQYADDTIICLKHDLEGARNKKILLYMYELMAGLKINFLKSEVLTINDEDDWARTVSL